MYWREDMLINHKTKQVILTPFKCWASSTARYFVSKEWENFQNLHPYISGDMRNSNPFYSMVGGHGNVVPNRYSGYSKILLIRNPYERVLSMWKWVCKKHGLMRFEDYFYNGCQWPTCFPVTLNYPHDHLVKVESYFDDMERLGIKINKNKFPHLNACSTPHHELTDTEKEIIYWFHYADFKAANYEK
jgi:hypothetical protein